MPDIVATTIDTHLDTDTPTLVVGGAAFDYASLRIGTNDGSIEIFGGTGTRTGDLARLTTLVAAATDALIGAAADPSDDSTDGSQP